MDLLRTLVATVSPGRAAVVTVDVQNDFCHQDGFLGKLGAPMGLIQAMVPALGRLLDAAWGDGGRTAPLGRGGPVSATPVGP